MVRIAKIVMNNFKSFGGRVAIPLNKGFTVITGPNGSGKSNIVDAISFVLGVSSAKTIRADKMIELIFNGGSKRKPAEFCEVSLYIENDVAEDLDREIKITRRVSRSGVSMYKLNGKTVPKRKIIEVLRHLGISTERYNIIMQGDITKIMEMNPIQRREIIDEISGIAEFKEKKEKAEAELEKVSKRVEEMMIVIEEKEKYVEKLKREKEIAEKYLKLTEDLKIARASLVKKTLDNLEKRWKELTEEISELEAKLGDEEIEEDKEIESLEKELRKIEKEMEKRFENYSRIAERERLRERLISHREKLAYNEREIRNLKEMLESMASLESRSQIVSFLNEEGLQGIFGTIGQLIKFPAEFKTAMSVVVGDHINDIVVDSRETAVRAIKLLKHARIGKARFIPLDSISGRDAKQISYPGFLGNAIDIAKFDAKFYPAMKYVFGDTAIFDNIDNAKAVRERIRIVTMEGDLIERSGAVVGGYMKKDRQESLSRYMKRVEELERENSRLSREIAEIEKKLEDLEKSREMESKEFESMKKKKAMIEKRLEELRLRRRGKYEERMKIQHEVNKKRIERAKIEGRIDNEKLKMKEYSDVKEFLEMEEEEIEKLVGRLVREINNLGPVNLKAIDDWKSINTEFLQLKDKLVKLLEERDKVLKAAEEINRKRTEKFMKTLEAINERFSTIYHDLTGGKGELKLEEDGNIDSGLMIYATPPGKKVTNIDSLSGGEKSLAAIAFLLATQDENSLFYVLDEIDAALDKANTLKIANLIKKYSEKYQFIVISHNDTTMSLADELFGVTMDEGVSKILSIKMPAT